MYLISQFTREADVHHLAQTDVFLHILDLGGDDVKVEGQGRMEIRSWFDVIGPLPSVYHGEFGLFGSQHRGQRHCLGRAPGGAVFMREVEAEFVLVILNRLQCRQFHIGVAGVSTWVDAPSVILCLALDDLLGQQPAKAATLTQTGAQADDAKGVRLPGIGPTSGAPSIV